MQHNDHATWTAECTLVMLKCRTGSLRAEMGGQKHSYINIGRGQLFLNNRWQIGPKMIKVRRRHGEEKHFWPFVLRSCFKEEVGGS